MKKVALQIADTGYTLKTLGTMENIDQSVSTFASENSPAWWIENGADDKPNLCTEIGETDPHIEALLNDGTPTGDFEVTSVDFEVCQGLEDCDGFIGQRPPRYPPAE